MFLLGEPIPDHLVEFILDDVQQYADFMRAQYKHQPIVNVDWPPKIGKNFFGRLVLQWHTKSSATWFELPDNRFHKYGKEISIEDIFKTTHMYLSQSPSVVRVVVIDGPPGIGKTTLCRKLLNMWSNGTLPWQQYDLVLHCPLRNSKIAEATKLSDLFLYETSRLSKVVEQISDVDGKGLLIIFDGWDELSPQLQRSSLVASIICGKKIVKCSVIVTSRSYASPSLLEMRSIDKHVNVIGFSEEEIPRVIIETLQEDPKLAQELIDEMKENEKKDDYNGVFTSTQSNQESQLAIKLINDLKVRDDVQSLCYVPLICSMVIFVYCEGRGHLPTTLTQLYEYFILQTVKRHLKIKSEIDPYTIDSLSSLPSQLAKPLQELCQIAYTNLTNTRMIFSSNQLREQSLREEDCLGLIKTFTDYDKKKHQFLHLSIQEFLAAWWIVKYKKKAEEVFRNNFDNHHFRMCLRFVAGLTHFEHDSYQEYFTKQLDLQQCKMEPLFEFEVCHFTRFYQNPDEFKFFNESILGGYTAFNEPIISFDDFDILPIFLLQLLYESQNTNLCQALARSIKNHSLCTHGVTLSLFDCLCLSYFINNSDVTWKKLHLGTLYENQLSTFTTGLTNNSLHNQCKSLQIEPYQGRGNEMINILLQPPLLRNIQEFYCKLFCDDSCFVLLQFLSLPQIKVLHLSFKKFYRPKKPTEMITDLEKFIEMNQTLKELNIESYQCNLVNSIVKGVTRSKTIISFSLTCEDPPFDEVMEQLLKNNNTLEALSLIYTQRSSLDKVHRRLNIEVNTPLTALEMGKYGTNNLMTSLLPHIEGLQCLILLQPYPPDLLFCSHLSLHTLALLLDTVESGIELFTILQNNTTLKALKVCFKGEGFKPAKLAFLRFGIGFKPAGLVGHRFGISSLFTSSMGTSLQNMLTQNQTLKHLAIDTRYYSRDFEKWIDVPIPYLFLPFLTSGLRHNNTLHQLCVYIPLPYTKEVRDIVNTISLKDNYTELQVFFVIHHSKHSETLTTSFYEHILPAVSHILHSHKTIRLMKIRYKDKVNDSSQTNVQLDELIQNFLDSIFLHPTLEYIMIIAARTTLAVLVKGFEDQKKKLIDRHKEQLPHKALPIVKFSHTSAQEVNDRFWYVTKNSGLS